MLALFIEIAIRLLHEWGMLQRARLFNKAFFFSLSFNRQRMRKKNFLSFVFLRLFSQRIKKEKKKTGASTSMLYQAKVLSLIRVIIFFTTEIVTLRSSKEDKGII